MKNIICILFAFHFSLLTLNAQWVQQYPPPGIGVISAVDFANLNIGAAGGRLDFIYGKIIYTTNSGANWYMAQFPDSLYSAIKLQLLDINTGYAAGAYYPFSKIRAEHYESKYEKLYLNYFKDYKKIIGIGDSYDTIKGIFLKTTNGGKNWFTYGNLPSNVYYLMGMKFININTGFVTVSLDPNSSVKYSILKTINGGLSWSTLYTLDSIDLNSIFTLDGNYIYATGLSFNNESPKGLILRSSNGGISWSTFVFPGNSYFFDLNFPNSTTGFAVTNDTSITALIYKTTNSGLNWIKLSYQNQLSVYNGVEFVSGTGKGIAYGNRFSSVPGIGYLLISRTTNYGNNWTEYLIPDTVNLLFGSSLIDANNWFICGGEYNSGIILKTTNGGEPIGVEPVSSEVPDEFVLNQNYPNPFNPVTKIKFDMPSAGARHAVSVRLAVYDILGREIAVLVNEELKPGSYEIEWNGSNHPSGVYFYKLTTQNFFETKKMTLLK